MSRSASGKVVIVVKTPHQRIADHRFDVDTQWTTAQLKELISTSYPSKPAVSQQKLIYAGQLMKDLVPLSEILKNVHPGENVHTIHLVCCLPNCTSSLEINNSETVAVKRIESAAELVTESAQQATSSATATTTASEASSSNSERVSNGNTSQSDRPSIAWPSGSVVASFGHPGLPFYATQHNVWYAQCYEYALAMQQQYYAAYADYLRRLGTIPTDSLFASMAPQPAAAAASRPEQPPAAPAANAAPEAPVPVPAAGPDPRALNAQGGVDDGDPDNEGAPNDWFDVAYMVLKVALLVSMFYSYSSWDKLLIGVALFVLVYALQRVVQRAVVLRPPGAAPVVMPPPAPVANAAAQNANANVNAEVREEVAAGGEANVIANANALPVGGLNTVRRVCTRIFDTFCAFFITFITSLLPERAPPLVAN